MGQKQSSGSSRQIREANLRAVLHRMWDSEPVTGSDLMASTGLTRATVHGVCEDLIRWGWIHEVENQRQHGDYRMGRPARRYAFRPLAGVVVGADCGQHKVRAAVADLRGHVLARRDHAFSGLGHSAEERLEVLGRTVGEALRAASVDSACVLTVTVGVPAPVDSDGRTVGTFNEFWERMNPDIAKRLTELHGWTVLADNDANLAALAEGWQGAGRGVRNYVTLLSDEAIGAGIVEEGHLLRGARGAAGELRFLDLVEGVGSASGIAPLCRDWAREAVHDRDAWPRTSLRELAEDDIDAEAVFAAANHGDPLATDVVERIGARFTRIISTVAGFLDTERFVLAGALSGSCTKILDIIERDLPRYAHPPLPTVLASRLGDEVVLLGAIRRALDHVREQALEIVLPPTGPDTVGLHTAGGGAAVGPAAGPQ
ncbi:N-acetylglucosamine repressor [Streptomyces sp. enrichment culture]|uniref:ROK family transcriptional regulator n=1 Tax=Streptomyces sp. enrichment culture TaxID=1795815 RepID=UPI003F552A2E